MKRWTMLAAATLIAGFSALGTAGAQDARRVEYQSNGVRVTGMTETERRLMNKKPAPEFRRQSVRISTAEPPGTIIVDSRRKHLYFVEGNGLATRYGVGVGKEGFGWSGAMRVGRKAEWPGWTPPPAMIQRERAKGRILPAYMAGGPGNPLGSRALYLYRGGRDSLFRIHGTNQPWTIGQNMSSGCIRMMNEDVEHLYSRVPAGSRVVVIGPSGQGPKNLYADLGPVRRGLLATIFGG